MLKIEFTGHVGADATVKDVNGQKAINFSIATNQNYTTKEGEKKSSTTWIECTLWSKTDNISQYLKKGISLWVSGTPSSSAYAKGEEIVSKLSCRVEDFEFTSKKEE